MKLPPALTNLLKRFRPASHGGTNPHRDWSMLLLVSLIALVASVLWNAWFFFGVLRDETTNAAAPEVVEPYGIGSARAIFDANAAEVERYRSEYGFIDPSN